MSIQERIDKARSGSGSKKLPNPVRVCITDDDYIYYANYCGHVISLLKIDLLVINFHHEDFNQQTSKVIKSIGSAHDVLQLCYQHLKLSGKARETVQTNVYTTTISHERR
tara:strand:+ start:60 stop:389 length:330 start_codon:yes stop_codon:yes gene_type:complete